MNRPAPAPVEGDKMQYCPGCDGLGQRSCHICKGVGQIENRNGDKSPVPVFSSATPEAKVQLTTEDGNPRRNLDMRFNADGVELQVQIRYNLHTGLCELSFADDDVLYFRTMEAAIAGAFARAFSRHYEWRKERLKTAGY